MWSLTASGQGRAWAVKTGGGELGPRVLWERDSRREPRGGQGGSGVRLLLPGTHPEPALGSAAGGGHLLWGEGAGAPCRAAVPSPVWSPADTAPSGQALSGCLHRFSDPPAISLCTHTPPLHRPPQGRKTVDEPGGFGFTLAQITGT